MNIEGGKVLINVLFLLVPLSSCRGNSSCILLMCGCRKKELRPLVPDHLDLQVHLSNRYVV